MRGRRRLGTALLSMLALFLLGSSASATLVIRTLGGGPAAVEVGESLDFEVLFDQETLCCVTLSLGLDGVPGAATVVRVDTTGTTFTSTDAAMVGGGASLRLNFVASVALGGVTAPKLGEFELTGVAPGMVVISLLENFEVLDDNEVPVDVSLDPLVVMVTPEPSTFLLGTAGISALAVLRRRRPKVTRGDRVSSSPAASWRWASFLPRPGAGSVRCGSSRHRTRR